MRHTHTSNRKTPLCLERLEDRLAPAFAFWVGDRPTNDWDAGLLASNTNWSDDQSPDGKTLVFDSSAVGHYTNDNDYRFLSVESLRFNGPGYTLTGNALNLTTESGITVLSSAGSSTINLDINFDVSQSWFISSSPLLVNGALSGAGGLTKSGDNTLTLAGTNTYAGPTVVEVGVLHIGSAPGVVIPGPLVIITTVVLQSSHKISDVAAVTMNGGVFDLDGHNEEIGSLAGTGTVDLAGAIAGSSNGHLTLGGDNTSTVFSGVIADDGLPPSPFFGGRLTKVGTGTFTLAGNNNYRGETRVEAGTLLVNGSQPRSFIRVRPDATLGSTSTLGGTGVTGPLDILDGTLNPGNGPGNPGILTAQGNVAFDLNPDLPGTLAVDINGAAAGTGYDQLKVVGEVSLGGTLDIHLGFAPAIGAKFTIIDNDGNDAVLRTFAGLPEGGAKMVNGNLFRITYKGGDGNDVVLTRTTPYIVTGPDAGAAPRVRVFDAATHAPKFNFLAYPARFKGGVRVASADVNGDGFPDIITAPGPGTAAIVKVFSGNTAPGQTPALLLPAIRPYGNFKGGAFVAAGGDVNGDGVPDIITGPGAGRASLVKIFSGANGAPLGSFAAFGGFKGGVTVAGGDVNGDGQLDIIAGMGAGNKPRVRIFDAASRAQLAGPLGNFLAYGRAFKGGVFVAAGDVNGDTFADVITGSGAGMAPVVKVFTRDQPTTPRVFLAYPAGQKKGVRVAGGDVTGDQFAEIVTALGPGGRAQVRLFNNLSTAAIDSFFAEAVSFKKGLFIAG